MTDAVLWHRIQFAFTITYHYLFPQLTMGLGLLIVVLKILALRTANEHVHGFPAGRASRYFRLVHRPGGSLDTLRAGRPRGALPGLENHRSRAGSQPDLGTP